MYITYVNHDSVIKQICQLKGNAYLINETMTTILSQRKAGPWIRDFEKTKGTNSIL